MNTLEVFSTENTAHLHSPEEKKMHLENAVQYAWMERHATATEEEFSAHAQWFREEFLPSFQAKELLSHFTETPEAVLDALDEGYLASVTKH